jgi:hypothetical protein
VVWVASAPGRRGARSCHPRAGPEPPRLGVAYRRRGRCAQQPIGQLPGQACQPGKPPPAYPGEPRWPAVTLRPAVGRLLRAGMPGIFGITAGDVGPLSGRSAARLPDVMFVSEDRVLGVGAGAAQVRLANLVHDGWLSGASHSAFQGGMDHLLRVGPLGDLPGASRLVRVQFLDPVYREDAITVGVRWETVGVTGGLFPVLDAAPRAARAPGWRSPAATAPRSARWAPGWTGCLCTRWPP